jgi:hypothetical protein
MKFRKKPVVIEAVRTKDSCRAAGKAWADLAPWMREAYEDGKLVFHTDGISIKTLEGTMEAGLEDWIIRGVKGELYPCKPDIFAATYEPVE